MTSNCAPSAHDIMHFIKRRRRRRRHAQGKRHRTEITRTLNLNAHLHFSSIAPALCHFCGAHKAGLCLGFSRFHSLPTAFSFCYPTYFTGKNFECIFEDRPKKKLGRPFFFFLFIDVKLFNSSSWVETLSKLTSFLSS